VVADLRELDRLTGGPGGSRRLCWGPEWRAARELLTARLGELGVESEIDEAGNLWAALPGRDRAAPALALGSHIDSVPNGGRLDGALGVMAALGVLRAHAEAGAPPPRDLLLVDFADEEGARFGRSLFGSSCVAGSFDPAELRDARDRDGRPAGELLAENGVALERAARAGARLERVGAYLELHIEQGPVLEAEGIAAAAVTGTFGVERFRVTVRGQASHAGTTPMERRRDALLAVAEAALVVERIARAHGGVGTVGRVEAAPGIPTAVAGEAIAFVDLRHAEAESLAALDQAARAGFAAAAGGRGCTATFAAVWRIEPIPFDPELVELAEQACAEQAGKRRRLASGALHDAAELARRVPAAMIFAPSIGGISHAPEEDTREQDLTRAIAAFGDLAARVLER
jgi:N-carbamoyl-L-amino-acid hydrolase